MSVKVVDRLESKVQYLQTAQELMKYTLQKALKLPKRYTFFITTDLVKTAEDIYKKVMMISTLYSPTDEHKALRKRLAEEAIGLLEYLGSQLDIVKVYMPEVKPKSFITWIELIQREEALLRGVIKKQI